MVEARSPVNNQNFPLLRITHNPRTRLDDVVLSERNLLIIERILREHHHEERLRDYGLTPVNRLLFRGPPGCGKALTAEAIALELGRPLVTARVEYIVSHTFSETVEYLHRIFEFISNVPTVTFFEGFDALLEGGVKECRKFKPMVNIVSQLLNNYHGRSLFIASIDHKVYLSTAVRQEFEEILVFDYPKVVEIQQLLRIKLRGVRKNFNVSETSVAFKLEDLGLKLGLSHADIERILQRAIKQMILNGEESLKESHIVDIIETLL